MDDITSLSAYLLGTFGIILLPGPNSMYCLSVAAQYGRRTAAKAIWGIIVGDSVLILATVLGAAALLRAYPALFHGVKMVGGVYLAYIAVQLLRGAWARFHEPDTDQPKPQKPVSKNAFHKALLLSLTNPKAILFFLSFFVAFVKKDAQNPLWAFAILALILQAISFSYLWLLAFTGERLSAWFSRQRIVASAAIGLVGLLFLGFSFSLFTAVL